MKTPKSSNSGKPKPAAKKSNIIQTAQKAGQKKPIKRIVIHVGTRKTGSTALQYVIRRKQNECIEQGVAPLVPKGKHFREFYVSFLHGTSIWNQLIDITIANAQANKCKTVFITSEDLYYLPQWNVAELVYYCQALAEKVEVIAFLRRQDKYLESSYSQYVTAGLWVGNIQENFESFLTKTIENVDHYTQISKWERICGEGFIAVPYAKMNTSDYLLKHLGLTLSHEEEAVVNQRKSLNFMRSAVYIGEKIAQHNNIDNHQYADINKFYNFRGEIRKALAGKFAALHETETYSYNLIKPSDIEVLAENFYDMNKDILSKYGRKTSKGFDDFSDSSKDYQSLSINELNAPALDMVLTHLITQLSDMSKDSPG